MNLCPAPNVNALTSVISHATIMFTSRSRRIASALTLLAAALATPAALAAPIGKPVAGQQVHFPNRMAFRSSTAGNSA